MEIVNNCNLKKKLRVLETQLPSDGGHLQQTLQKVFFLRSLKVALQFCKAGSESALRKTAGSGNAKNQWGSTALTTRL